MKNKSTMAVAIGAALTFALAGVLWVLPAEPETTTIPFPKVVVAPEDLGRLESEAYKVCAAYDNLDLSGMVAMCKLVHYQG